jgi:hypothetical protein
VSGVGAVGSVQEFMQPGAARHSSTPEHVAGDKPLRDSLLRKVSMPVQACMHAGTFRSPSRKSERQQDIVDKSGHTVWESLFSARNSSQVP